MQEGGIDIVIHGPNIVCPYFRDAASSDDPPPRYPHREIYRTRFLWSEERSYDIYSDYTRECSPKFYEMGGSMKIFRPWAVTVCC